MRPRSKKKKARTTVTLTCLKGLVNEKELLVQKKGIGHKGECYPVPGSNRKIDGSAKKNYPYQEHASGANGWEGEEN